MTKLTDGKRTVEIEMLRWDDLNSCYGSDWSDDFFEIGGLQHDPETDAYLVPDVDYCIHQASDAINCKGDFFYDEPAPGSALFVDGERIARAPTLVSDHDFYELAGPLFDGGWRSSDKAQLIAEYDLTEEEAVRLCELLAEMDEDEQEDEDED